MLSCIINISFSSTHIERFQTVILLICFHLPEFLHGPTLHLSRKTLLRAGKIINANFKNIPTVVCFSGYSLNDLQNGMCSLLLGQYLFTNNTMSGNFISCTEDGDSQTANADTNAEVYFFCITPFALHNPPTKVLFN